MLMGVFQNSIDAKNRVIIPAKLRTDLGTVCIITKGLDDCLVVYPIATWKKQEETLMSLPQTDEEARAFIRFVYLNASDCEIDKQGRTVIPQNLLKDAGIVKDVVTVGHMDRVEIWAKEKFESDKRGGKLKAEDFKDLSKKYLV